MVKYPITVPRRSYGGRKDSIRGEVAEHNRIATEVEKYLNGEVAKNDSEEQRFEYYRIATALGYDKETIRSILYAVESGEGGITIEKPRQHQK